MITRLDSVVLKSGEHLQLELVTPPDEDWDEKILPFLGHKPVHYRAHIEAAFAHQCDDLETRFYIGVIDGHVVGNIMTVEADGLGILGHVHTAYQHRRKGIASAIMSVQMEHFRSRSAIALALGTGYDSHAYRIYKSFGFTDLPGGRPGLMEYINPGTADKLKSAFVCTGAREPKRVTWRHWPLAAFLASRPQPNMLNSITFGTWGTDLLEGPFCKFMFDHGRDAEGRAAVIESDFGAVAAIGTCVPDPRWKRDVHVLDLIAHDNVPQQDLCRLVTSLLPSGIKTQAFVDVRDARKIAALTASGFTIETTLDRQYLADDTWQSVLLLVHYS